jgi:hypothetical protein
MCDTYRAGARQQFYRVCAMCIAQKRAKSRALIAAADDGINGHG